MQKQFRHQAGFEAVGVLVAILIVAVIGFAGFKVMHMNKAADSQQSASQPAVPAKIQTKSDLSQTGKSLDAASGQLDSSLNDGSLDADMDAML
jgi:heme/copper-type cytochrome/quinol oxidase subunit 2